MNNPTKKILYAEMMGTAGPRKENDEGLSEDSGGVIIFGELCFFWISDGTSESSKVINQQHRLNLSSRTLAMSLGNHFRICINKWLQSSIEFPSTENIADILLRETLTETQKYWQSKFDFVYKNDQSFLPKIFQSTCADHKDFSSTFSCGVFDVKGNLDLSCYGDSPYIYQNHDGAYHSFKPENRRFFLRLNKKDGVFTTSNTVFTHFNKLSLINRIILCSDGVDDLPNLISQLGSNNSFTKIRELIPEYFPHSHDDKTMCMVSIVSY